MGSEFPEDRAEYKAGDRGMTWEDRCKAAPLGTKAPSFEGGYWVKTVNGWKWHNGAIFPVPGGDWTGELIEPGQDKMMEDDKS